MILEFELDEEDVDTLQAISECITIQPENSSRYAYIQAQAKQRQYADYLRSLSGRIAHAIVNKN